jgi:hypothetical protein
MSMFQKATKKRAKARMAITGPAKSGKSFTSLSIAKHLGERIAAIDTERGSLSKYANDVANFDVVELTSFAPKKYLEAMRAAAAEGYDVLVIDSLSHAWMGEGGLLDQKDKAGGNSFNAWRTLTPQHNELVDAILSYPGHVIVTMRVKTEYVIEQVGGKSVPRKLGLAPVQRDGMEYEFDVMAEIDRDHTITITDTRCSALDGVSIRKTTGADIAAPLLAWLDDGAEPMTRSASKAANEAPSNVATELFTQLNKAQTPSEGAAAKQAIRDAWKRLSNEERDGLTTAAQAWRATADEGPKEAVAS